MFGGENECGDCCIAPNRAYVSGSEGVQCPASKDQDKETS